MIIIIFNKTTKKITNKTYQKKQENKIESKKRSVECWLKTLGNLTEKYRGNLNMQILK